MKRINSLLSAGVTLTSSGTAVAAPIPLDSAGYFPQFVRVVATGAGCFVKVGDIGVTAVSGDCMIQPLDGTVLNVRGCKAISAISVSGTSSVTVVPLEAGSWNYDQRTLDYNFTTLSAVPSTVTFTRGTGATYFGSDGLLKVQGYNLLLQSQTFNTTWTQIRSGVSADATAAPDGTLTADKITEDASTNTHYVSQSVTKAASATIYTMTVYAKAAERGFLQVVMANAALSAYSQCTFNLSDGTTGGTALVGFTSATNSATNAGNSWWRCTMTFTTDADTTIRTDFRTATTITTSNYAGTIGSGIYLWGAQLEAGSTATQYSPTTTAANSAPRLDYDPVTLLPRGLLVEEQRSNLVLNSNSGWTALGVASVVKNAVGPDGVASGAWTVTESSGTSGNQAAVAGAFTPTVAVHTASVFVKAGTKSICQLFVSGAISNDYANFTLSGNGTVNQATTLANCAIQNVGGGWYRISMSFTAAAVAGNIYVGPISATTDTRNIAYTGASGTIYEFGAQVELGSFSTSYIPTSGASAPRSADSASMTGTSFSSWYNQTQGTFVVEAEVPYGAASPRTISLSDNTTNNVIEVYGASPNQAYEVKAATVAQANIQIAATTGSVVKQAFTYATNDFRFAINGILGTADTAGTVPTVSQLNMGNRADGLRPGTLHIRRVQFYPVALPSAIQSLTA